MKEYLKAQSKTNEIIVGNAISADELDRFSKSDFRWADREFPKVCVNLYTDVRYTYQYGGFIYG